MPMHDLAKYVFHTFVSVFVIVDPFSVVPVYLTLTRRFKEFEVARIRDKATTISLFLLLLFAFGGMSVFHFFDITLPAFQIAGGLLLLILGIGQLNASSHRVKPEEEDEGLHKEDISVFPLAIPLLAGPGAISAVILQGSQAHTTPELLALATAIVAAAFASNLVLRVAPRLFKILGQTGLNILTRLMGIFLAAIAVQYILNGVSGAMNMLLHGQ